MFYLYDSAENNEWILDTSATNHMTRAIKNLMLPMEAKGRYHINLLDGNVALQILDLSILLMVYS